MRGGGGCLEDERGMSLWARGGGALTAGAYGPPYGRAGPAVGPTAHSAEGVGVFLYSTRRPRE